LHICECLRNYDKPERPEPPELVKALARAKDRRAAYSEVYCIDRPRPEGDGSKRAEAPKAPGPLLVR
jgi:hypothetical protein